MAETREERSRRPTSAREAQRRETVPTWKQLDLLVLAIRRGGVTVREAREALDADLAYTSVLTVFQTLEQNGLVEPETVGKAHRYHATVGIEDLGVLYARLLAGAHPALGLAASEELALDPRVAREADRVEMSSRRSASERLP